MGSMAMAISFIYNGSSCIKAVPMPVVLSKCTGVMAAASPLPLLKKPSSSTDKIGPMEHSATRPKLSASACRSLRTWEIPTPRERMNGTVMGPVVTPPESKAILRKSLSAKAARANTAM